MGRITPSFRQLFVTQVEQLRKDFQRTLLDKDNRDAFDLLIRAWYSEDTAMSNANIPCVLDNMNLLANVHNKKCIEQLCKEAQEIDKRIFELEQRIGEFKKLASVHEG